MAFNRRNRPIIYRSGLQQPNYKANINGNPFGCLLFIIAIILIAFVLTHIGPIWSDLSRVFGG